MHHHRTTLTRSFFSALNIFLIFCAPLAAHAATPSPASVFPAASALHSDDGNVQTRLVSPITFGKFTSNASGSVSVDPRTGSCTGHGGAIMVKPSCARGVLEIWGAPGAQVMVNFPQETSLSGTQGNEANLTDFKMDVDNPVILGSDGKARIGVGATLSGPGAMRTGEYSGQFQVETSVLK